MTAEQTFKVTALIRRNIKIENDAEEIVSKIEDIVEEKFSSRADTLATKQDINDLKLATKQDINDLKLATKIDTSLLQTDMANLKTELADRINNASLKVIGAMVVVALIQVILKHYGLL